MSTLRFDWDDRKAATNLKKHGVSFEEAKTVFFDERAKLIDDPDRAIAVIHAALDAGITLLDTADIYAPSWNTMGHNEILVGQAFHSWNGTPAQKSKVVLATKAGITREENGTTFGFSGRNSSLHCLLAVGTARRRWQFF